MQEWQLVLGRGLAWLPAARAHGAPWGQSQHRALMLEAQHSQGSMTFERAICSQSLID